MRNRPRGAAATPIGIRIARRRGPIAENGGAGGRIGSGRRTVAGDGGWHEEVFRNGTRRAGIDAIVRWSVHCRFAPAFEGKFPGWVRA